MQKGLKDYFPLIREREEVLAEIHSNSQLSQIYYGWSEEGQKEFLDFCTGVKGVKLLYDGFFKEIFNPDVTPERLENLLSLILKTKVKILKVLPHDSARIAAEYSLLFLDVVVQLEDGSIANVEAQKIGYAFPGQRSACYSADLLLRQYKRVRGERGKKFSYRDIKKVYTIVFFEKSTREFHKKSYLGDYIYIHHSKQQTNTGLNINLLQEYVFIALDILGIKLDNKGVSDNDELEAWMACFCSDKPEVILELIEKYPSFKPIYEQVYEMCRNLECVMGLFSKELIELDKNTAQYMIDEQQNTIDEQQNVIENLEAEILLNERDSVKKERKLEKQEKEIKVQNVKLSEQEKIIETKNLKLVEQEREIAKLRKQLASLNNGK